MNLIGIVPTGLYRRLGQPWWAGVAALFALVVAAFLLAPGALIVVGLAVSLIGGAAFGYRGQSFWWALVAVVAAWLVSAFVTTVRDGWDIGPGADVIAAIFFAIFLAGATLIGGLLGKSVRVGRER